MFCLRANSSFEGIITPQMSLTGSWTNCILINPPIGWECQIQQPLSSRFFLRLFSSFEMGGCVICRKSEAFVVFPSQVQLKIAQYSEFHKFFSEILWYAWKAYYNINMIKAIKYRLSGLVLRWNLQRNIIVIPDFQNPGHIKENMDIFDFSLTQEDMGKIRRLDCSEKHDRY